jgi:O-antigen/teichoic acid export membrane protein
LSIFVYPQIEPLVERLFNALAKAPETFADARMFFSYQYTNVVTLGVFVAGAGLVLWLAGRLRGAQHAAPLHQERHRQQFTLQSLTVGIIAVDLMVASWGFNPASDPALLDFTPPAIQWLQQQPGYWRYTTLDDPAQRPIMNANLGWRYKLYDIRGYESIIPKQYVAYMVRLTPQVQLDFNRVAPLYTDLDYHTALDSPLLDLLNVRYVMTHKNVTVNVQGWQLVYEDEAVRIWENDSLVPRAYTVAPNDVSLTSDLDGLATSGNPANIQPATITQDSGREKWIEVSMDAPSMLVVSETYLPGWRVYVQNGEDETALDVQRVEGNFQGVLLDTAGDYTIRMVYSPTSFQAGAFASFISAVLVAFMVGAWGWRVFFTREAGKAGGAGELSGVTRVARNSLAPIILNLFNRGIDFAFAAVMLRVLGPADSGLYQYAVVVFVWFDIFTNFGLNTFLTREVSRDRSRARYTFFVTSAMRLGLIVIGIIPLIVFFGARQTLASPPLDARALTALGLLYIGLLPNSLSTGMTALFYAFEKAEYPSAVATLATVCKAVGGLLVLLLGYGIIGLAAVSIVTNVVTLAALVLGGRPLLARDTDTATDTNTDIDTPDSTPPYRNFGLMRKMAGESWPLMLNHFLATIFFQVDVILIEAAHGARMVGQYGVAYKWLTALNVIPAFFTMAMLPGLSRQAQTDRAALKRTYTLAIKLLFMTALPLAVMFTFLAYVLTALLGGAEYLPDGAIATQLMIWSIPIGWMNSLTQYVLIALNIQRRITSAFVIAVTFNIVTNLILIPPFGYRAAALTTIASELILLIPFAVLLHRAIGPVQWSDLIWRPIVAAAAMFGVMLVGWTVQPVLAVVVGVGTYAAVLVALRPFSPNEIERLSPLVPARFRAF